MARKSGGVTPLSDGRFWARITVEGKRQSLGVHPTEEAAKEAIEAALTNFQNRTAGLTSSSLTLATYGAKILDRRELAGVRGIGKERANFKRHVLTSFLSERQIVDVRGADVWRFVRELSAKKSRGWRKKYGKKLARKTVARCFAIVSTIFLESVREELREDNPCTGVKIDRNSDAITTHWDWLRGNEQVAFSTCENIPLWGRLMCRVAWGTGLRQGEQWNLELRDIHLDGPAPYIYVQFGSKGKLPKSGKTRKVPLFGDGLSAMREWLDLLPSFSPSNPERLAFPTGTGCRRCAHPPYRKQKNSAGDWRMILLLPEWLKAAGISRKLRWHDLRHTCASSLVSGTWGHKWNLYEVKELLGHASIVTTQMYSHLDEDALGEAVRATKGVTGAVIKPAQILEKVSNYN